jgi:dihydroflavonol-4-reductase
MAEKVLITGATGFIGSGVARNLAAKGYKLRFMIRRPDNLRNIEDCDAEFVDGDLLKPETFERCLDGCDGLIHVAAYYTMWTLHPELLFKINVDGTRLLLEKALAMGIPRVLYTSSVAAIGKPPDGPGTEETEWNLEWVKDPYVTSKHLAMQEALKVAAKGLNLVIVCPSAPMGPGDIVPTPTGKMICDFLNRKIPAWFDGGLNIIDVDDLAEGHYLAYTKGKPGEKYILAGKDMYLNELYGLLSKISGIPAPKFKLPRSVAHFMGWAMEQWANLVTKKHPVITLPGVRMISLPPFYSNEKAKRELGLRNRPIEETFHRSVEYFYNMGYAKPLKRG